MAWLNSVSCLSFGRSLEEFKPNPTDSGLSTNTEGSNLPPFLQEQGTLNATKELLEKVQVSRILENMYFMLTLTLDSILYAFVPVLAFLLCLFHYWFSQTCMLFLLL